MIIPFLNYFPYRINNDFTKLRLCNLNDISICYIMTLCFCNYYPIFGHLLYYNRNSIFRLNFCIRKTIFSYFAN